MLVALCVDGIGLDLVPVHLVLGTPSVPKI